MARTPDPDRKPELVASILEYLSDRPLSTLTFRDLATHLHVSTYTLVSHFGTRAQLVSEIVATISARQRTAEEAIAVPDNDIDAYFAGIMAAFEWSLDPANNSLQRLEFEAAILEAHEGDLTASRASFAGWLTAAISDLMALGLSETDATVEARILNNLFAGFQYDLVINRNVDAARTAFVLAMERYRERLQDLIELAV
jgi:AcrR family transcriptional regulator